MSTDSYRVTRAQVEGLLRALGLHPVDLSRVVSIHMAGPKIEVVRCRLDESGHPYAVGNELATESVTIAIVP